MYQTGLKREEYYEGTIIDIRKIFVGFGHWLERLGIENEGTLEDYECYLCELDKQKELKREDEHLELLKWIDENEDIDFPFKITNGNEYDRFMESDDEDDVMDMLIVEGDEFYIRFKEMTGVHLINSSNFIGMTYIDKNKNDIEVVITNVNGDNERYIIGV